MVPRKLGHGATETDTRDRGEHKHPERDRNDDVGQVPHDLGRFGDLKVAVCENDAVDVAGVGLEELGVEGLVDGHGDVAETGRAHGDHALHLLLAEELVHPVGDAGEAGLDDLELEPRVLGNSTHAGRSDHLLDELPDKGLAHGLL